MKSKIIIFYSILACLLLYFIEKLFHPSYFIQMIQKLSLFILIPLIISFLFKIEFWRFGKFTKKSLFYGIWFWVLSWIIVIISYFFLKDFIDWNAIKNSINSRWVTKSTFVIIFAYIMFWNSLVEEYFFRGIIFNIWKNINNLFAYFISSIAFSLYHITIFWTWFHGYILVLALFWLFLWWLFFAWLYKKTSWIWSAYIFHIIVDLAILIIWYIEIFN